MPIDLAAILAMRASSELARLDDATGLLGHAAPDLSPSRRATLETRIAARANKVRDDAEAARWEEWEATSQDADPLVAEVVGLAMTRILRSIAGGAATFDAAGALLGELSTTAGIGRLVVGHTQALESIDRTRGTVNLRYPGSRGWDLAFLVHEFGHYAVSEVRHREPVLASKRPLAEAETAVAATLKAGGETGDRATAHAAELAADIVACACLGPAYALACLCLRVPPVAKAAVASNTHPSWIDRVATMLATFEAMTVVTQRARYRQLATDEVAPLASALLGQVPAAPAAGELGAHRIVGAINEHVPALMYLGADSAIQVEHHLRERRPAAPAGATVCSVVDGAWRWRLGEGGSFATDHEIAELVVEYCRQIAVQRGVADAGNP